MVEEIVVRGRGDFTQLNAELGTLRSGVGRTGAAIKAGLTAGVVAGVYGLGRLSKASIGLASDAQQSFGATETVFGKYADSIVRNSRRASNQVGLSKNDYRESANLIGALLKNQGLQSEELVRKTSSLVKVGADLAATFGGPTADAVDALASAYKGEFDPLERYGISLKQSQINTEALGVANVKTTTDFNKLSAAQQAAAKRQATTNLLMRQSADATGTFRREAGTLAGQQQRLEASVENLGQKFGHILLPYLTDLARYGNREVVPFVEDLLRSAKQGDLNVGGLGDAVVTLWDALKDAGPQLQEAGAELPSLTDTAKVAAVAIGFLADHSDELAKAMPFLVAGLVAVKAAQAGANAVQVVSPALKIADIAATRNLATATRELAAAQSAGVGATRASTAAVETQTATTAAGASGLSKYGLAARGVAGVAGLGALTASATTSDRALSVLGSTAGGALTGFAAGGPIGAAIGGGIGALTGLFHATQDSTDAVKQSTQQWSLYTTQLDQATGAITEQTRAAAYQSLQEKGAFEDAQSLGISRKTLLNATLGVASAQQKVSAALEAERGKVGDLQKKYDDLAASAAGASTGRGGGASGAQDELGALDDEITKRQDIIDLIGGQIEEGKKDRRGIAEYLKTVKGVPKKVTTRIQQDGVPKTIGEFRSLIKNIRLTPKNIRTLVETTGIDLSKKQIRGLIDDAKAYTKTNPRAKVTLDTRGATTSANAAENQLVRLGKIDAKPTVGLNASPFAQTFTNVTQDLNSLPKSKTITITTIYRTQGNPPKGGGGGGGGRVLDPLLTGSDDVTLEDYGLDAGGRLAGAIADGLRKGGQQQGGGQRGPVASLLAGLTSGSDVDTALDRLEKLLDRRYKSDKVLKAILKSIRDESAELRKQGRLLDQNNNKLDAARSKLKNLVQESKQYASGIRESLLAYGDVTGLGVNEDGSVSLDNLLTQMEDRVAAAKRYAELIEQLREQGLNKNAIQDLLDKGVEGGLATAEAIASGGAAAIDQVNQLTHELSQTGQDLGDTMADEFYGAGIQAAQGLIRGLLKHRKQLLHAMQGLVGDLLHELNGKGGGGHGGQRLGNLDRLQLNVDETHARRQGQRAAKAMREGFASVRIGDDVAVGASGRRSSSSDVVRVELRLVGPQMSALQRGQAILADIDVAKGVGTVQYAVGITP